jgi:hypothetical protein
MNTKTAALLFGMLLLSMWIYAQDSQVATQEVRLNVASTALIAIAGPPVVLQMNGAAEAGDAISQSVENQDTRLRISSLVSGTETRSISAKISETPVGTRLLVSLLQPNVSFTNTPQMGELKGEKTLGIDDVNLIEGIGTCWSGKQDGDGYVIKYKYEAIEGATILRGGNVTITYTIFEAAIE